MKVPMKNTCRKESLLFAELPQVGTAPGKGKAVAVGVLVPELGPHCAASGCFQDP